MKVTANKTFTFRNRQVNPGDVIDMNKSEAEIHINYNLVKKEEKKKRTTKEEKL